MRLIKQDITIGHWDNKDEYKGRRKIECALEIESEGTVYEVHYDVTQVIEVQVITETEGDMIGAIREAEYEDSDFHIFDGALLFLEFNTSITEQGVHDLVEPFFDQKID